MTFQDVIDDFVTSLAVFALAAVLALGGCAPAAVYSDPGPLAIESGDVTALLAGCGHQTPVGSLYCRLPEGWKPTGVLFVSVPPVECPLASCATVTIWPPDASSVMSFKVPKGEAWVAIKWTDLVGTNPLRKDQRGFWPVLVKWTWTDPDTKVQMQTAAEGEIRLRVYAANYSPLNYDPSSQTWTWSTGGKNYGATDRGRTAVEP